MKEMAQLSQLVHPNIVRMYGIVIEGMFGIVKSYNFNNVMYNRWTVSSNGDGVSSLCGLEDIFGCMFKIVSYIHLKQVFFRKILALYKNW